MSNNTFKISVCKNVLRIVLWPGMWSVLVTVPWALEKDVCSAAGRRVVYMSGRSAAQGWGWSLGFAALGGAAVTWLLCCPRQVKNEVEKLPRQQRKDSMKQKMEEHAQKKQLLVSGGAGSPGT